MNTKENLSVKVIIADDHKFFRDGLEIGLKRIPSVRKITHAANGKEVLRILKEERHDIVFMDIEMPLLNGMDATKEITKKYPNVKVIALSMHHDRRHILDMFYCGAVGYIIKDTDRYEIEKAIIAVMAGNHYYSSGASNELLQKLIHKQRGTEAVKKKGLFTEREEVILRLIGKEFTTKEISEELFLTVKAIEFHRSELLRKTDSKNVTGLVKFAIKYGYCDEL